MCDITAALLAARLERPYYRVAIAAMTVVHRQGVTPTLAVDESWRIYYNADYLDSLTAVQAGRIIAAHEVEHLLRGHSRRRRAIAARHDAWNICTDAEINDDVPGDYLPPGHIRPVLLGAPDGLTAEDYYSTLITTVTGACGGGSGTGNHLDGEEPPTSDTPGIGDTAAERIRDAVAVEVRAHVATHGRGSVPAGVLVWAEERAVRSRTDWRRVLASVIVASTRGMARGRDDYSWARLSRRTLADPSILRPATTCGTTRLAIIADTSGSMSDQGGLVLGEVEALVRVTVGRGGTYTVWSCDAQAVRNRRRGVYLGGGGTDLRVGIKTVLSSRPRPDAIVVVTDCATPWPDEPTPVPCIVAACGPASHVPVWCIVVQVDSSEASRA